MWILTPDGFYSIVQKPHDREQHTLTVRARVREDLERLRAHLPTLGPIHEDPAADYRFRAQAHAVAVGRALARLAEGIAYDNFKRAVRHRLGQEREALYHEVWQTLAELQEEGG